MKTGIGFKIILFLLVITLGIFVVALITLVFNNKSAVSSGSNEVLFMTTNSTAVKLSVEVADTLEEREEGLMYRASLDENSGMLFVFDKNTNASFWMKNTKIPLDMIFINDEYEIVSVIKDAQPCLEEPCKTYNPEKSYRYAIETNAGWTEKNRIEVGDRVSKL